MVYLYVTELKVNGIRQSFVVGDKNIDSCLELLTSIVKGGCQLVSVHLVCDADNPVSLPLEAFDGKPMRIPLQSLQQQLKEILYQQ
jgi:hypothetical protein